MNERKYDEEGRYIGGGRMQWETVVTLDLMEAVYEAFAALGQVSFHLSPVSHNGRCASSAPHTADSCEEAEYV